MAARSWSVTAPVGRVALLLLAALVLRAGDFGNPVIHVDEQYYLLVGDRMLHGAMPYLDIWDRKPVGLFLLFAGFRLLPGDGILAYQIAATGFAVATAAVVAAGATRIGSGRRGAIAAGLLYLLGLSLLGGRGGQSPVFYNLPVAVAGLLVLRLPGLVAGSDRRAIVGSGGVACLLAGIAIQVKYTAAVEGAVFGIAHLWALARAGARPRTMGVAATGWLLAGLLPTLAAVGWYWRSGPAALEAFLFANFGSIALRPGYPAGQLAMRLLGIVAQLSPLMVCAALAWRRRERGGARNAQAWLLAGWMGGAVLGFLAIGTFFDHYALPLLAPLAIAAAPTLDRSTRALAATIGPALLLFAVERASGTDDAAGARRVAALARANSGGECPYVFIGDTVTYHLADACLPTAYAFPNLLAYSTEQGATGIDEAAEVARVLRRRPPVIIGSTRRLPIWNRESLAVLRPVLARDYRLLASVPRGGWRTLVFLRRDRAPRPPARR